jgi:hypothetical protein
MIYYTDEVQSFVREKIEFYEKFEVVIKWLKGNHLKLTN